MFRYIAFILYLFSVFCNPLIALEWWDEKPYIHWSEEQVLTVLEDSPWVGLSTAGARRINSKWIPVFYRVRLLTAKPIREAYLRRISLNYGTAIDVRDLDMSEAERQQSRIKNFIASDPNSFLIEGDNEFIAILLTLRVGSQPSYVGVYQTWREEFYGDELPPTDPSKLIKNTKLETDTGKRLELFTYVPSGPDHYGAKFLFKRRLPDSTYIITEGDKELRFETRFNSHKIKVRFDLTKMRYRGKLEY